MYYYRKVDEFSKLYEESKNNQNFKKLYEKVIDEDNILLAYRTMRTNKGSKTIGCDNIDIRFFEKKTLDEVVEWVREDLKNYQPRKVRRVFIPKANGKRRPLGIPSIKDRLIQQCIRQILEPICEAKFYKHSYGFRANRSTHDALGRNLNLINHGKLYYIVNIDIKGFFDNVNHSKLIQQIYTMGIRDKRILSIIKKMLKAEIEGEGIPTKGVPQGGILSPLLSNIVLNELDWWIASQWDEFPTEFPYVKRANRLKIQKDKTNLKEVKITRYADDFQIYTRYKDDAIKIYNAVVKWLKERLKLDISEEKSCIIDIRNKNIEFLGFTIRAIQRHNKITHSTEISEKNINKIYTTLKNKIKEMIKNPCIKNVTRFNQIVYGTHEYFKYASQVSINLSKINWKLYFQLVKLKKKHGKPNIENGDYYNRNYQKYKTFSVNGINLAPIYGIKHKYALQFNQEKTLYTKKGRELIQKSKLNLSYMVHNFIVKKSKFYSLEMINFGASLIHAQLGKCAISDEILEEEFEIHHKKPTYMGGTDHYFNLIAVNYKYHKLIHITKEHTIKNYMVGVSEKALERINKFRKMVGNEIIEF